MLGQVLARHLRIPGIVLLLGLGVAAGPDGLGLLQPDTLGGGLSSLVTFVVAIILFEGGMALDLREVWHQGAAIRRLVTVGALITAVGGALAVHLLLGWERPVAILFGTLVIVTGPTVIQPLLRRIRITPKLATILEGEAILGDAVGATVAVLALELLLAPSRESIAHGWVGLAERIGFGIGVGLLAGTAIALAVRFEKAVPSEVRNAFAFAILVGFYQVGEAIRSECGIVVAITAGLLVGNLKRLNVRGLHAFKEEMTTLVLGLVFVLLAADTRLDEIRELGWGAVGVVAALMFVVRPINVLVSTAGAGLSGRERAFLSWLAPRGIVAAAVASFFAEVLEAQGVAGGSELRALVFLVIATTVTVQGLSGGFVARRLGVARPPRAGWAILGANGLGLALAERVATIDEVVFVDASTDHCRVARARGYRAIEANALDEATLFLPDVESRLRFVATTPNDEVNYLFARRARELLRATELWIALRRDHEGIEPSMLREIHAHTLFGSEHRLELWALRFERGLVEFEERVAGETVEGVPLTVAKDGATLLLPLAGGRGDDVLPFSSDLKPKPGDLVEFALFSEQLDAARAALDDAGWILPSADDDGPPVAPP